MQIIKLILTNKNINEVIQLIKQTFLEFVAPDYDESGIKNFFKFAEDEDLLKQLVLYAALHNNKITGILAVDDKLNHICLFFVDKDLQNTGIGTALFKRFLNESMPEAVTVNKSLVLLQPAAGRFLMGLLIFPCGIAVNSSSIQSNYFSCIL